MRRWNSNLLSHSMCVFIREWFAGLYVVMLLALLMDEFLSKRSHESIKAVIQVGSFTVQIPRMDEMPPMQQHLRKFVIESRWKKQIHIHLQVNDFLTPIYSLTICLVAVAMSFKGTKRPSNMEHFNGFFLLKKLLQQRKIKTSCVVLEVLVKFLKKSRVELQ